MPENSTETVAARLRRLLEERPSILGALGISFDTPSRPEEVRGRMPVDERTCQPYGCLSGGASLALAESLAGWGSALLLSGDEKPVGVSVSANHVSAAPRGGRVVGTASLVHRGRTTHVWNVDIRDEATDRLVSTVRVLNHIVPVQAAGK